MKNVTLSEIKESGATFGKFLGFDIDGRLEADEVVLTARVMLEENSDAYIHVAEVSCETMKEAKETLKEELRNIEHNANDIKTLAIENDFVGTHDDLIELLSNEEENTDTKLRLCESPELTEEQMAMIERQTAFDNVTESRARELFELGTPITIRESYGDFGLEYSPREYKDFDQVIELLDSPTTAYFMVEPEAHQKAKQLEQRRHDEEQLTDAVEVAHAEALEENEKRDKSAAFAIECAQASAAAEEAQDAALIDAEEAHKLDDAIQSNLDNIDALKTATKRADAYRALYIETHRTLLEHKMPKSRTRVSNLAVDTSEVKTTARGEAARIKVGEDAMKHMNCHSITFDRRGKYKDWFISGVDADGEKFTQRLDAFKNALKKVMNITK